jgi:hypothetical protein
MSAMGGNGHLLKRSMTWLLAHPNDSNVGLCSHLEITSLRKLKEQVARG